MPSKKIVPSLQQKKIIEGSINNESFSVSACAGSGKSTVLKMISEEPRNQTKKFLYIVFNNANAVEARRRFTSNNIEISTANSLGYKAIITTNNRHLLKNNISPYDYLEFSSAKKYIKGKEMESYEYILLGVCIEKTVIQYCRSIDNKIQPHHLPKDLSIGHEEIILSLAKKYWSNAANFKCNITHDVYMKLWSLTKPNMLCDYILYDEAQDTDAVMLNIVNNQKANKIIVGDSYQQIYGFRGSIDAMDKFDVSKKYELNQSYRYGEEVAEIANKIITLYNGKNPDIKGSLEIDTEVSDTGFYNREDTPVVTIGRTNGQLISQIIEAQDNNQKVFAYIDTKNVKQIIRSLWSLKNKGDASHELLKGFKSYEELNEFIKQGGNPALATYMNLYRNHGYIDFMSAITHVEENKELVVKGIHSERFKEIDAIMISAHKCKGLEFPNVKIHKDFYNIINANGKPHPNTQPDEGNLTYVALTRAQKTLDVSNNYELKCLFKDKTLLERHGNNKNVNF